MYCMFLVICTVRNIIALISETLQGNWFKNLGTKVIYMGPTLLKFLELSFVSSFSYVTEEF